MSLMKFLLFPLMFAALASSVVAQDEELNSQLMRATVKISHDTSTATGFILSAKESGKFVLVTASHVFENTKADETRVIFRKQEAEGGYQQESMPLVIRKDGKATWTKHPTEDVAVIAIIPPKNVDLPVLSSDLLASDASLKKNRIHPGELLSFLGFPHRVESNEAGFPILRSGAIATFPLLPTAKTKTFLLSVNVFEGDSGGPVYLAKETSGDREKDDLGLILGLVSGQRFLDEEAKMIYGTTKVRHRLGLAIIIHASFIKETIDQLP